MSRFRTNQEPRRGRLSSRLGKSPPKPSNRLARAPGEPSPRFKKVKIMLDDEFTETLDEIGWNVSIPLFICTSILYYQHNESVVSDEFFDKMCKRMRKKWERLEHPHKHYIKKSMLRTGSGYNLPFKKLPFICHGAANSMLDRYYEVNDIPRERVPIIIYKVDTPKKGRFDR